MGQMGHRNHVGWGSIDAKGRLRRYKAKGVKTRGYQEGVGQFERRFQGEGVVPGEYVLVCTKLDTFCYPTVQTAP